MWRSNRSVGRVVAFVVGWISLVSLGMQSAHAVGADYDGNGFSEIPVLSMESDGTYTWTLFDPFSGRISVFTRGFGVENDRLALANWIYSKITSAGVVSMPTNKSNGRLVWRIRTAVKNSRRGRSRRARVRGFTIREQVKYLGRPGDIILTGGDFNGDKIADAVVITDRGTGRHKWGLRGSFFLASYNPGLNVNRAYFDFGIIGVDRPFFVNPDGKSDWFAVVRTVAPGRQEISLTQPFTKQLKTISVSSVPDDNQIPIPLAQDDGSDFLVFWGARQGETLINVKDLAGRTVYQTTLPIDGEVTVGNYGPGPGEEIAVSASGIFFTVNPITARISSMRGPDGHAADSININTLR